MEGWREGERTDYVASTPQSRVCGLNALFSEGGQGQAKDFSRTVGGRAPGSWWQGGWGQLSPADQA